ncbi:MAG: diacylglycerol kinase [Deltaproteobacteria bacterium]|nr:diacylglycerol kinase [Deltaproteobacteria bacterium]
MKPENWFETLNCAIEGILYAAKHERHVKVHFIIAAAVLTLSLFLDIKGSDFILLAISITFVIFAELINSAIEYTIDLIHEEFHPLAKAAKDVAAGAVLIASFGALIMGYIILSKPVFAYSTVALESIKRAPEHITMISLIIVIIVVVIMKSHIGKGTPLHGGMPSGHSAISFSVFTAVSLISMDPFIALLVFALALMVSHSRLLLGIHSKAEVITGALLGFLITLLFFQLFR